MTLGLTSQRELDAAVAKAAKAAGVEAPRDTRLEGDREALIEELRAEREAACREAEAALAAEQRRTGRTAAPDLTLKTSSRAEPREQTGAPRRTCRCRRALFATKA